MLGRILSLYRTIFGRKVCYNLNKGLFLLSLRGLGILNYESRKASGERNFLKGISDKVGTVFDIGGCVGDYARDLRKLNLGVNIFSFEPHPVSFRILEENSRRFDFKAFNFGFGKTSGIFRLYDYGDQEASSHASLYREVIEGADQRGISEYDVEIRTLDAFCSEQGLRAIDLIKMDTEGNEYEILLGASRLLADNAIKVIHFEFNRMNVVSRVFLKDFYELLEKFEFYRMLPDGLVPLNKYEPLFCEIYAYQNIVAVRKDLLNEFGLQKFRK